MNIKLEVANGITVTTTVPVVITGFNPETKVADVILSGSVGTTAKVISGTDEEVKAVIGSKLLSIQPDGSVLEKTTTAAGVASKTRTGSSQYVKQEIR